MNPLTTGIVAAIVLAAIVAIVACFVVAALQNRTTASVAAAHLPSGADAALWSIVEAVPDPRNHLALTRDLSGEVHITADDREAVAAMFADKPKVQRLDAPAASVDLREPVRITSTPRHQDQGESGREDLALTGQLFFSGKPQLNRF